MESMNTNETISKLQRNQQDRNGRHDENVRAGRFIKKIYRQFH